MAVRRVNSYSGASLENQCANLLRRSYEEAGTRILITKFAALLHLCAALPLLSPNSSLKKQRKCDFHFLCFFSGGMKIKFVNL